MAAVAPATPSAPGGADWYGAGGAEARAASIAATASAAARLASNSTPLWGDAVSAKGRLELGGPCSGRMTAWPPMGDTRPGAYPGGGPEDGPGGGAVGPGIG